MKINQPFIGCHPVALPAGLGTFRHYPSSSAFPYTGTHTAADFTTPVDYSAVNSLEHETGVGLVLSIGSPYPSLEYSGKCPSYQAVSS